MKKSILSVALTATISTSAFAHNSATQEDLNFAFNNVELNNVTLLSKKEMEETRGQALPVWAVGTGVRAGWGAIGGGVSYVTANWGTDNFSWKDAAKASASGAVAGAVSFNNAMGATFGAAVGGLSSRFGW